MARPQKPGLSYFPFDTVFDDKIELLIAEFGPKGLGILVCLWQKIYLNDGYYCKWDNDVALMFAKRLGVGVNDVSEVIKCCFRRDIFDNALFEKQQILTSKGIQKKYLEACTRRTKIEFEKQYLLIDVPTNSIIVNNNSVNVNNNSVNVNNNSTNKSKVNKSKEKKNKSIGTDVPPQIADAFCEYIKFRKQIKKPLTDYGIELSVKKLQKLAPDNYEKQIAIINQSIERGWQGLFELKDERSEPSSNGTDFKPSRR